MLGYVLWHHDKRDAAVENDESGFWVVADVGFGVMQRFCPSHHHKSTDEPAQSGFCPQSQSEVRHRSQSHNDQIAGVSADCVSEEINPVGGREEKFVNLVQD